MEFGPVIKNPVLDINKLVRQGTMLNQSVQNVEGDSTADQATTDLLAKKDPVIHEISVGISGEEASQYTVSGTPPLSLPNSLGKPLKAWSVDVLPYQEGTGDPSPDNVRPIHGTDKLNLFVEESYDQSATPKAVLTLPQTVYTGTIGSDGGESRSKLITSTNYYCTGAFRNLYGVWACSFGAYDIAINSAKHTPICDKLTSYPNLTYSEISSDGIVKPLTSQYIGILALTDATSGLSASSNTTIVEDTFTSYLNALAATFVYDIETPVQFPLTTPSIPTPTGTATTWATAEDGTVDGMEVTYVGKA